MVVQIGESTVIVTTSHAKTVSLSIEGDQWQVYQIESPRKDWFSSIDIGFGNTKAIGDKVISLSEFCKPERIVQCRPQDR